MMNKDYQLKDGNNIHSICQKAIYTYGAIHQKIKAIEELGELIEAINNYLEMNPNNVEEEMADVEIMICQLRKMYPVTTINHYLTNHGMTLKHNLNVLVIQLSRLISELARSINGEECNVEKHVLLVERAIEPVKYWMDKPRIDEIKIEKLERLAGHIW